MLVDFLIGFLIVVTFLSLFINSKSSQKGFYRISILGVLLALVLILVMAGIL
jgi:hypothetical protein